MDSFTGTNTNWTQVKINLDQFAGEPSVLIFFQVISNGTMTQDGWYIDDVVVTGTNCLGKLPVDFDGDCKSDIGVYRDGIWFILRSSDGTAMAPGWGGLPQDIPVPADYDGDGKTDIAVYRGGTWFIIRSSDGRATATGWGGLPEDIPLN
jgi:hypothetical protein